MRDSFYMFFLVVIECGQFLVLAISHVFTSSFQVMNVDKDMGKKKRKLDVDIS